MKLGEFEHYQFLSFGPQVAATQADETLVVTADINNPFSFIAKPRGTKLATKDTRMGTKNRVQTSVALLRALVPTKFGDKNQKKHHRENELGRYMYTVLFAEGGGLVLWQPPRP